MSSPGTARQAAHQIMLAGGWTRIFLEARILSRASLADIAHTSELPADVVAAYMRMALA